MKKLKFFGVLAWLFCLAVFGSGMVFAQNPPSYTVSKVGNFPDGYVVYATGINDGGQVVGYFNSNMPPYATVGFIWNSITNTTVYLGENIYPKEINNSGKIVGNKINADGSEQGFFWQNGEILDFGDFYPTAINDNNQIVGYKYDENYYCTGYLWENGNFTNLCDGSCMPLDINNFGKIVGEFYDENYENHGFLWESGNIIIITGTDARSNNINLKGQIVGDYYYNDTTEHAFFWDNGVFQDFIGDDYYHHAAYFINDFSQIIGTITVIIDGNGEDHIFLWDNNVLTDLNDLLKDDVPRFFHIASGDGFNNKGQLVVVGESGDFPSTDSFLLTPTNQPPEAATCGDQTGEAGVVTTLDASGSSDPDGNYPLTYAWTLVSAPNGSTSVLDDPSSVSPSFTPDMPGTYVFELVVTDSLGNASAPVQTTVTSVNNPPTANAGPDQVVVQTGTFVTLDGSQSADPEDNTLSYAWTIVSQPECSAATLNTANVAQPTLPVDCYGTYVLQVTVTDCYGGSDSDEVIITFENVAPVANAGVNQSVAKDDTVYLDGSLSSDANGDALTYAWSLVSKPSDSNASLSDSTLAIPTFVADQAGEYVLGLVVSDGILASPLSSVTVVAVNNQFTVTENLQNALAEIEGLLDSDFDKKQERKNLSKEITSALKEIDKGKPDKALNILQNKVIVRLDGCALRGTPDLVNGNDKDWITNCDAQDLVYQWIVAAMQQL